MNEQFVFRGLVEAQNLIEAESKVLPSIKDAVIDKQSFHYIGDDTWSFSVLYRSNKETDGKNPVAQ